MKNKSVGIIILCGFLSIGCTDKEINTYVTSTTTYVTSIPDGNYRHAFVTQMHGFAEERENLLASYNVSVDSFIKLSTDSAWGLTPQEQETLIRIRSGVSKPDEHTLLQKIIPLEDISTYMNNIYGGTIGGFVCEAADVKSLTTMKDVYWGLRLDYEGTKFFPNGAGYAVIRFYSKAASRLKIPYSPELGGSQMHAWPNGGGGFTTSTLGEGGYPEWVCDGYNSPEEGAELYEVTPQGREILRSIYKEGKWQTFENKDYPLPQKEISKNLSSQIRNGLYDNEYVTTYGDYQGFSFILQSETKGYYNLTTTIPYPVSGLKTIEKGIYGLSVPISEVSSIREVIKKI